MPAAGLHRLTNKRIQSLKRPVRLADGGGLFIQVTPTNSKSWLFSKMIAGKRITKGLGPYPEVSLATARRKAETVREALSDGVSVPCSSVDETRIEMMADAAVVTKSVIISGAFDSPGNIEAASRFTCTYRRAAAPPAVRRVK